MKTTFDLEANIMMFTVGAGEITHAKEKNGIIIHMTHANVPVLIEILDASKFIGLFAKLAESQGGVQPIANPT
jgi:hypothetical protein